MTADEVRDGTDVTTIEPLLEEVRAAEAAWRDGALPPLRAADRLALRLARRLLRSSRHHRERTDARRAADEERVTASKGHAFERRVDAGPLR